MSTINFDDINTANGSIPPVPNGYNSFTWNNFFAINGPDRGQSYATGTVSRSNVAFNGFGTPASFSSSPSSPFTVNSFFLTSGFNDTQTIRVTGSLNGAQIYSADLTANNRAPTLQTLNWSGINQITFTPTDGVQTILDNLRVNEAVQPAPCYITGTRIRVLFGYTVRDVPVERLRVGDLAVTASGKPRPIRWIGTRSYLGLTAPKHDRPVRIHAGALSDGVPARDLLVSPDHCLWLDGLLVAAGHLVNGTSITRGEAVADLTYWHVELDSHDLLMAENTPAESFLAAPGVRAGFDGPVIPNAAVAPVPYAVRTERGPELDALRERLILRAGLSIEPTRFGTVRAWMDCCNGIRVAGWAQDAAHPDGPVCLDIVVDGAVVAMTLAEEYRADIAAAGIGDGCHGFDVDLDAPLTPGAAHVVEVRRSADGLRICAMEVDATGTWTPLLAA